MGIGENWHAKRGLELQLVDELKTSDDYLLHASQSADIYEIKQKRKKTFSQKIISTAEVFLTKIFYANP